MQSDPLLSHRAIEQLRHQAHHLPGHLNSGNSRLSGPFLSAQRGAGMELEELRPYQTGDDVRHIAWRASARSGKTISKIFRAEQQQRVLLYIEQHPGMAFASRGELKASIASRASALICFASLRQGAELGGILIREQARFFDCSKNLDQTHAFISAFNQPPSQHPAFDNATGLLQLQRLARRDDRIYLISDFQNWDDRLQGLLKQLREQHTLYALQISDPGEQALPAIGQIRLRSPFDGNEQIIDTDNKQLREQYAKTMAAQQSQLTQLLRNCGIHHHLLATDGDTLQALAAIL